MNHKGLYTKFDCLEGSNTMNYKHRVIVLNKEYLVNNKRTPENQLWIGISGKGLVNFLYGKKLIARSTQNEDEILLDRDMILGILKDDLIPNDIAEQVNELSQ